METNFNDEIGQSLMIQAMLTAMPDLPKMYPKITGLIEMLDKGIEDYLGDNEKMVVLTKKNGVTLVIVLDLKKEFTLNHEIMLEGKENPVLNKYEKTEWINKIMNSAAMQILKERYEKLSPSDTEITNPVDAILKNINKS